MLRSVTLGVLLGSLATACAIVDPPLPPGTRQFQVEVRNLRAVPAEVTVTTPSGMLPGAAQPASLPAGSTTVMTVRVPAGEKWSVRIDGEVALGGDWTNPKIGTCELRLELKLGGNFGAGCFPSHE